MAQHGSHWYTADDHSTRLRSYLPLSISACVLTCALPGAVCPGPKIQAWFQDGRPHIRRGWTRHVGINKVEWQKPVACVPAAKARLCAAFVQDAGDYNFVNPAIKLPP